MLNKQTGQLEERMSGLEDKIEELETQLNHLKMREYEKTKTTTTTTTTTKTQKTPSKWDGEARRYHYLNRRQNKFQTKTNQKKWRTLHLNKGNDQ